MTQSLIVIPARYQSSRFPGKPLVEIAGKSMLERVHTIALKAIEGVSDVSVVIATDDNRIASHAAGFGAKVVMTPTDCATGSDRALAACDALAQTPDIVINLQGDTPLTPPRFVRAVLQTLLQNATVEVATPVVKLSWAALDDFRQHKIMLPFSGTTVTTDPSGHALWFSKQIIPAIRNEAQLRRQSPVSPVFRHIGLYGYRYAALQQFVTLPPSNYENLEGLEQLRLLENGIKIKTVEVDYAGLPSAAGVDTLQDAQKTEQLILAMAEATC